MDAEAVGSVVVLDSAGAPAGILTDRDLRRRVLAAGRPPEEPVGAVMSAPVVSISPEAFVFEALLEMTRRGLHHLAVVEAGRLVGVISSHDLILLHAAGLLEVSRTIQACASFDDLASVMPRLTDLTRQLFEQGLSGYEIGRIVTEVNDAVIRRVLDLVGQDLHAADLGAPPVSYCWLALGSEGRREQTLRTDQDNGLVYADPGPMLRRPAAEYFRVFAERVVDGLIQVGYPRCPGDAMASNPKWCQPLAVWRGYFAEWARDTTPGNLMDASIYLDFRPVAGDERLADELRNELRAQVQAWRSFPRYLAKIAVSQAPALGWFGRFKLQWHNGRRGINMKLGGLLVLNNALRAYAIDLGLEETNTIERLEAVARVSDCFTPNETEDVRLAYETIFRLRLRHQLAQLAEGGEPDNLVEPATLSRSDQRRLKDAFRAIRHLQGRLEDRYFTQAI
jgi:CBS domain-containing protein